MSEHFEEQKAKVMCPHGNFPSRCEACKHENRPLMEKAKDVLGAVGLSWEDLKGKKTLEIGAGLAELSQAAKQKGIDVVALEKDPSMWEEDGEVPTDVEYIVGEAEQIPLEDSSVDVVISKAAPPTISQTREEVVQVVAEAMRILKPDGVFRFGPARMAYLGEEPIFTEEEKDAFSTEQRADRVLQKSFEVLQEMFPTVARIDDGDGIGVFELRKPPQEN
jgi:ubiquinone/menaquinone biosynthesis C-methylase UbiE